MPAPTKLPSTLRQSELPPTLQVSGQIDQEDQSFLDDDQLAAGYVLVSNAAVCCSVLPGCSMFAFLCLSGHSVLRSCLLPL